MICPPQPDLTELNVQVRAEDRTGKLIITNSTTNPVSWDDRVFNIIRYECAFMTAKPTSKPSSKGSPANPHRNKQNEATSEVSAKKFSSKNLTSGAYRTLEANNFKNLPRTSQANRTQPINQLRTEKTPSLPHRISQEEGPTEVSAKIFSSKYLTVNFHRILNYRKSTHDARPD